MKARVAAVASLAVLLGVGAIEGCGWLVSLDDDYVGPAPSGNGAPDSTVADSATRSDGGTIVIVDAAPVAKSTALDATPVSIPCDGSTSGWHFDCTFGNAGSVALLDQSRADLPPKLSKPAVTASGGDASVDYLYSAAAMVDGGYSIAAVPLSGENARLLFVSTSGDPIDIGTSENRSAVLNDAYIVIVEHVPAAEGASAPTDFLTWSVGGAQLDGGVIADGAGESITSVLEPFDLSLSDPIEPLALALPPIGGFTPSAYFLGNDATRGSALFYVQHIGEGTDSPFAFVALPSGDVDAGSPSLARATCTATRNATTIWVGGTSSESGSGAVAYLTQPYLGGAAKSASAVTEVPFPVAAILSWEDNVGVVIGPSNVDAGLGDGGASSSFGVAVATAFGPPYADGTYATTLRTGRLDLPPAFLGSNVQMIGTEAPGVSGQSVAGPVGTITVAVADGSNLVLARETIRAPDVDAGGPDLLTSAPDSTFGVNGIVTLPLGAPVTLGSFLSLNGAYYAIVRLDEGASTPTVVVRVAFGDSSVGGDP